jgi:hypothetical protein
MVGWLMSHGWGRPQDVADVQILIFFLVALVLTTLGVLVLYLTSPANIQ